MQTYLGLRLIPNASLVDVHEDWSQVRSPARAKRRRKKHPQRIRFTTVPSKQFYKTQDAIYAHPDMIAQLLRTVDLNSPFGYARSLNGGF